jgi:hypothetical protein
MPIELSEEDRKELLAGHVPKERFDEATGKLKDRNQKLTEDLARLQGQVQSLQNTQQQQPQQEEPVRVTRAQLRAYVEDEKLTQDEADQIWDKQVALDTDKKINDAVAQVSSSTTEQLSSQKLADSVAEYVKILPDLNETGTENRSKVTREYDSLARILGYPKAGTEAALKLELAALEKAFGPADKLRERVKAGDDDPETMESLSSGGQQESGGEPQKGPIKGLSTAKREYYQRGIDAGRYKDWDDVKAELEFTRKKK